MTGIADDYVAEMQALREAWAELEKVDPGNEWLQYFDPKAQTLRISDLIAAVWDTDSFDRTKGRMIHLMARYTARLEAETRQPA